jgi:hypothetical protein
MINTDFWCGFKIQRGGGDRRVKNGKKRGRADKPRGQTYRDGLSILYIQYKHLGKLETMWRACNLTTFIHSCTDPVVHSFASRYEGPGFNPQGRNYVKLGFSC